MKNRNMFYQNTYQSYNNPGMFIPPNGYNMNTEYQAYGPNVMPQNQINNNNDYEDRISKLERQVRNLDTRLQKIENANTETTDNFYMI
ncbi:MAG: hypothetical protein IKR57_01020 [Bacilli bacterium]|nr:hypothetical protein [Bacilli bacterium]